MELGPVGWQIPLAVKPTGMCFGSTWELWGHESGASRSGSKEEFPEDLGGKWRSDG